MAYLPHPALLISTLTGGIFLSVGILEVPSISDTDRTSPVNKTYVLSFLNSSWLIATSYLIKKSAAVCFFIPLVGESILISYSYQCFSPVSHFFSECKINIGYIQMTSGYVPSCIQLSLLLQVVVLYVFFILYLSFQQS